MSDVGIEADTIRELQFFSSVPFVCELNNEDYDSLARKLSWLGIDKDTFQRTNSKGNYKWEYDLVDVGYKYHGNSIMASVALIGLKYLDEDNIRRREICEKYEESFSKNPS